MPDIDTINRVRGNQSTPGSVPPAGTGQEADAQNQEAQKNALSDDDIKKFTFSAKNNAGPSTSLYYPSSLESAKGDTSYVNFQFFEYVGPYTSEGQGSSDQQINVYNASVISGGNRRKPVTDGSGTLQNISLYMPEDIQAQYGTQWGGKSIQGITADTLKGIGAIGGLDAGKLFENISRGLGTIPENAIVKATQMGIEALQKTGQAEGLGTNDVLGLLRGVVLNPNTELLFSGFDLRTFTLNFKMVARSQPETNTIKNIITTFKKAMLPSIDSGEDGVFGGDALSFIKVPALVDVKFMVGANEHPYVTQFKPCAITGMNVNYTPDGSYAVYENFAPVAITLQLQFSETKLVYREDINWGGATY